MPVVPIKAMYHIAYGKLSEGNLLIDAIFIKFFDNYRPMKEPIIYWFSVFDEDDKESEEYASDES